MKKVKLSKKSQVRERLIRNLLSSLILFEQIETTPQKAKALKSKANSFLARIKKMDSEVNLKRYINSYLYGGAQAKAYDFKDKFGVIKSYRLSANRFGDNAERVLVKLMIAHSEKPKLDDKQKKTTKEKNDRI